MTRKSVTTTKDPSIAWAEHLWERLEVGLLDTQNSIIAIIDARAWEPLGYESFSKAWIDKIMSKVTIASELRPHVVYQMFDEGLTANQISDAVKGITPTSAELLKRQKDHGVPADLALTTVRKHQRRKPSGVRYVHFEIDSSTLATWKQVAKSVDKTVSEIAKDAAIAAFDELT